MTLTLIVGAGFGLGLFLLVRALFPGRTSAATMLARVDARAFTSLAAPSQTLAGGGGGRAEQARQLRERIGKQTAAFYARQGWQVRSLRADLAILERPFETFLGHKVLLSVLGIAFGPLAFLGLWIAGWVSNPLMPLWLALACMVVFFFLPDLEVWRDAKEKRRDFLRVTGVFLSLVANNLAGGRGLPEALKTSAEISDSWPLLGLRRCLADARLAGVSYWSALDRLGEEIAVHELRDLAAALALSADDGARIRQSLTARADTMRQRELAELEGAAGAQSQTMLVAQLLLCTGFLIFLAYPALTRVMNL